MSSRYGFFVGADGKRYHMGAPIDYNTPNFQKPTKCQTVQGADGRSYWLAMEEVRIKHVNRKKHWAMRQLIMHPSEKGWALPTDHRRHLLNLPQEILDLILHNVLTPPQNSTPQYLQPRVASTNWKSEYATAHYTVGGLDKFWGRSRELNPPMAFFEGEDHVGKYTEIRRINFAPIDATILRAFSNSFYAIGNKILYGENAFLFDMGNPHGHSSPPTMLADESILHPCPRKPFSARYDPFWALDDEQGCDVAILQGVMDIRRQVDLAQLSGWVYHDPFLRFLSTIGRKNAALIKNLTFRGIVKIHECGLGTCRSRCDDRYFPSLELYLPFMIEFCPGLERLTLCAQADNEEWIAKSHPDDSVPITVEYYLHRFLKGEFPRIKCLRNLRTLKAVNEKGVKYECAEEVFAWVKHNSAQRIRNCKEGKEQAALVASANVHCGFCGEGHVWAECYNLCSFCGEFGHFVNRCQKAKDASDLED